MIRHRGLRGGCVGWGSVRSARLMPLYPVLDMSRLVHVIHRFSSTSGTLSRCPCSSCGAQCMRAACHGTCWGGGTRRRGGFGPGERRARAPGTCASLTTHPPPSTSPPERARAQWGSCVIGLRYSRAPCSHLSCGPRWGPRGGRSGGRSLPPDARPSEGPAAARTSPPVATTSGRVIPWGCSIWHAPHHEKTLSAASHLRSRLFGGRGPNLR